METNIEIMDANVESMESMQTNNQEIVQATNNDSDMTATANAVSAFVDNNKEDSESTVDDVISEQNQDNGGDADDKQIISSNVVQDQGVLVKHKDEVPDLLEETAKYLRNPIYFYSNSITMCNETAPTLSAKLVIKRMDQQ
ncbi:hypothetical protein MAM1_0320c09640 [Mucor ambiguus]|uniref:Uncharacterized protein n=1 Tax=Mucor ambiguus TaxID=91626 RepID=A0A0C9MRM6_9FUNG|nr:hypothetical protein MAM1_0320c09640 [Mucor ambiguus]